MKVTRNREVIVGLSVLLALAVTLVGVIVWRFTRPDKTIAKLDESKPALHGKEIEARRPTFEDPAPTTVADAQREHEQHEHEHHEANPWVRMRRENHGDSRTEKQTEKRDEKPSHASDLAPKAIDVGSPPSLAIHERHEKPHEEEHRYEAGREPAVLSPEAADDRYAIPSTRRDEAHSARPMVVQVSGDAPSAPYATTRRDVDPVSNGRPSAAQLPPSEIPPAAANYPSQPVAPNYGAPSQAAPNANYPQQNYAAPNSAAPNTAARDPRFGYESTAAAPPADNAAAGYPGPGYGRAESARREEYQQQPTVAPNPLRSDGMYEVLPNDSYWTISQRVYGTGAYFRALAEVNRGKAARPEHLSPGLLISTPPIAQMEKEYPDSRPRPERREAAERRKAGGASLAAYNGGRTYVVQEGDTVWTIARYELGKVSRWGEIVELNRAALGKDYDYLTPGMKLILPPTENRTGDRTARRASEASGTYPR